MDLNEMKNNMVDEMKKQGASESVINWAKSFLKTSNQIKQMMTYLISIREQHVPQGKIIEMIDNIAKGD